MSAEILRVHPDEPQPDRIDYIVSCLQMGDVVALPTDTFYGLAVDPVNLRAVERIYQIKTRQKHKPLSLLIASLAQAYTLVRDADAMLDKLADRFWPGPLTIIVRASSKLPLRCTKHTAASRAQTPTTAAAAESLPTGPSPRVRQAAAINKTKGRMRPGYSYQFQLERKK